MDAGSWLYGVGEALRSSSFSLLCFFCFVVLLGLRFALPGIAKQTILETNTTSEAAMAVPPKPEGISEPATDPDGVGEAKLTTEACQKLSSDVQDVCWQALARQQGARDPDGALALCPHIADSEMQLECRSDVAEAIAEVDRNKAEQICETIESIKWKGQCNFGIGLALAETDPEYALSRCDHAEIFKLFCRHDVNGEVSLVNTSFAVSFCAREEGSELQRKTCWHGIGKYLARRDIFEAQRACDQTTLQWRGNCFHGMGWGAAERDVEKALSDCEKMGDYRNNCRQGVAYEQKRSDPARAIELCSSISDMKIQTRCLEFLRR